ncbi:seven-hairpin glycosidase [Rhizodiscina lignyota]|uniref:alpha-1,2-Mannosidase n=1 Tax=Rhizodiscina lignyota TaxID=1504668 RepID=A0A9P4IQ12_9PEZI|nr:seven-hairpin glycosidase [Rhizodiscina lignyota]
MSLVPEAHNWTQCGLWRTQEPASQTPTLPADQNPEDGRFDWSKLPQRHPVSSLASLPSTVPNSIPKIQHVFEAETASERSDRLRKLDAIKGNFSHAWEGYKAHAWLRDEVMPLSGQPHDPFGGWAATLVDSLDSLWTMELYDEFSNAVEAIDKIDFSTCALEELNVFETTIRYLGGFLAAYDLSDGKYPSLLTKATDMGEMLYHAFDTPNRMPITRWNFNAAAKGFPQEASDWILIAELGSLSLEFTRLSQLTGDMRFFDAVQRIADLLDAQQDQTKLPGMWPIAVNAKLMTLTDGTTFTIGGMADSTYEYLPKQHIILGGGTNQYQRLYEKALKTMKQNIFYRPMTENGANIRFPGQVNSDGRANVSLLKPEPQAQHLSCFAGGMVGIGAKIFASDEDLTLAKRLVEGCLWGYEVMPLGIMPEIIHTIPCDDKEDCPWEEDKWHSAVNFAYASDLGEDVKSKISKHGLGLGVAKVDDTRYILRPEAIESIFILYRITGDNSLRDRAWTMFNTIVKYSITDIAHAGLNDCTKENPPKQDRMESFWLAETLKYFYLIFSEPDKVSLDEYVLNTEAHPLRRPI